MSITHKTLLFASVAHVRLLSSRGSPAISHQSVGRLRSRPLLGSAVQTKRGRPTRHCCEMSTLAPIHSSDVSYVSADTAAEIDRKLMGEHGYGLEQLMELAGFSVACAVEDFAKRMKLHQRDRSIRVCVACGPGNNGGDGLVCARHLCMFGFNVSVVCPVNRFAGLTRQLEAFRVPFLSEVDTSSAIVVDALFGFSFRGPTIRAPFPAVISAINSAQDAHVISVDVPSGWDVDKGNTAPGCGVRIPDALISLTAPKLCAKALGKDTVHYVGGRFVPDALCEELNIRLPAYEGTNVVAVIGAPSLP